MVRFWVCFVWREGARFFIFHWQAMYYEFSRWVCLVKFSFYEAKDFSAIKRMVGWNGYERREARQISQGSTPKAFGAASSRSTSSYAGQCLLVKHPGILADERKDSSFATTAIFSRFPNENPENATFVKSGSAAGHDSKHKGTKAGAVRQASESVWRSAAIGVVFKQRYERHNSIGFARRADSAST